jgi:hypothetical protein
LNFFHPTTILGQFERPSPREVSEVYSIFIFAGPLEPPEPTIGGRLYHLAYSKSIEEKYRKFSKR